MAWVTGYLAALGVGGVGMLLGGVTLVAGAVAAGAAAL
jgi:hypothetical protein